MFVGDPQQLFLQISVVQGKTVLVLYLLEDCVLALNRVRLEYAFIDVNSFLLPPVVFPEIEYFFEILAGDALYFDEVVLLGAVLRGVVVLLADKALLL